MKFEDLNKFSKIYILVSGGFDSTYLFEKLKKKYSEKVYAVNCFNPYEWNETLKQIEIQEKKRFIKILPKDYKDIIRKSFLMLPYAYKLQQEGKYYGKKIFPCCRILKHKEFKRDNRFKEPNTVVVSGIKWGDSKQRRIFLSQLHNKNTFFHRNKDGILYYYPFRDFPHYELTEKMKNKLYKKYPNISHSGCILCPILVLFNLYNEGERYEKSLNYAEKLGVLKYKIITEWI